jgi:hypothetical protein
MSPSITKDRPIGRSSVRFPPPPWAGLAVIAALVCAWAGTHLLAGPHVVARITISNPTPYDIDVSVTDGAGHGSTGLGVVPRRGTATFEDVADEGPVWVFMMSAQGESGGQLQMARGELVAAAWRLTMPSSVEGVLRAKGAPEPP